MKLSGGNGDLRWAHLAPHVGNSSADSSGNLIVTTFGSDELFKLDGSTGEEIWRVSGTVGGLVGGVSIDEADDGALAGIAAGSAGGLAVSKISGLDGGLLWQRVFQDERGGVGGRVTTDHAGDVIACGELADIYHDPYEGDVWNSKGVVVKLWGRTGADFPPTALQILRALSDAVTDLKLRPGLEHSLVKQVDSASSILSDGNPSNDSTAVSPLRLFISHVSALKHQVIDPRAADDLISLAQRAIAALAGT